jgi:hypothetical protein
MKGFLIAGAFLLGVLVALAAVVAALTILNRGLPSSVVRGAAARASAPAPAPTSTPTPTAAPPTVAARTLLDLSGSGNRYTPDFTVGGGWDLAWSYDCTAAGRDRLFGITVENGGGLRPTSFLQGVSKLGTREAGTVHNDSAGTFHLEIGTDPACTWHAAVDGPPGPPLPTPRTPALLDAGGSGVAATKNFVAAGPWDLFWSYDCTSLGRERNFGISAESVTGGSPQGDAVIQLGEKESGLAHYQGVGTFHLKVDADAGCSWHVTVSG